MLKIKEDIIKYYFYFIQERMNIFWNKLNGGNPPWTDDSILSKNKFTNVYRASDRVSQYLIKNVIYNDEQHLSEKDILFRILLFKIFNKIETWEYLERELGVINTENFNLHRINQLLQKRILVTPIFSNAYMMTGTLYKYNHLSYKHEKWLQMLKDEFFETNLLDRIIEAKSLEHVYILLRNCPLIGDFLAYQYTIDINYSNVVNFSEDSFVKAGIGAIRGIKKCFEPLGNHTFEDAIKCTHENFDKYQKIFGFNNFKNLFGRNPTLIDIQNCFCETDKYLRVKKPELQVDNKRIKQKYKYNNKKISLFFPPKWNINTKVNEKCSQQSMKELTLF